MCIRDSANGHQLITDQGESNNYRYAWEVYDNPEIIFAEKAHGEIGTWDWPWSAISPPNIYPGNRGQSGITPTLNFVKKYEKRTGEDQYWDPDGGSDLQAKMGELDYRFSQTIAYNKSIWNEEKGEMQIWEGGRDANTCHGGFWLHKHFPAKINNTQSKLAPNSTLFQLNEFYLSYAEALNEYYNGPTPEAYAAVKTIRDRSGQPPYPSGLDYEGFKKRIHRERDIELAFDNHRLWDIMRWKEGKLFENDLLGIYVPGPGTYDLDKDGTDDVCFYVGTKPAGNVPLYLEIGEQIRLSNGESGYIICHSLITKKWNEDRDYLYPVPISERTLSNGVITQNPGWNDGLKFN